MYNDILNLSMEILDESSSIEHSITLANQVVESLKLNPSDKLIQMVVNSTYKHQSNKMDKRRLNYSLIHSLLGLVKINQGRNPNNEESQYLTNLGYFHTEYMVLSDLLSHNTLNHTEIELNIYYYLTNCEHNKEMQANAINLLTNLVLSKLRKRKILTKFTRKSEYLRVGELAIISSKKERGEALLNLLSNTSDNIVRSRYIVTKLLIQLIIFIDTGKVTKVHKQPTIEEIISLVIEHSLTNKGMKIDMKAELNYLCGRDKYFSPEKVNTIVSLCKQQINKYGFQVDERLLNELMEEVKGDCINTREISIILSSLVHSCYIRQCISI